MYRNIPRKQTRYMYSIAYRFFDILIFLNFNFFGLISEKKSIYYYIFAYCFKILMKNALTHLYFSFLLLLCGLWSVQLHGGQREPVAAHPRERNHVRNKQCRHCLRNWGQAAILFKCCWGNKTAHGTVERIINFCPM